MVRINVNLPEQNKGITTQMNEPDLEVFDELKEKYGFTSRAEAARAFMNLGMKSIVVGDPRNPQSQNDNKKTNAVTIRELVPKGKENSVSIPDEFCDDIIKNQLIDIVADDPEIKRDGLEVYRE